ncbi:hypothetical protein Q9L58_008068 [Maublancomyces gigas]|uniref:Thioredoxin domain-containing protein n=1 Tax=Discina gigas TaxID=1032678 RepID=A0ABR3GAS3_9PEZI
MPALVPSAEFVNVTHFRQVVGSVHRGQKLAVIFYEPMATPCWEPTTTFHAASTDPVYAQNMMFFSINTSRKEEMEEVLEELSVTFVPMVAFWDGNSWEKVTLKGQNDILAVLASHRG